MKRIIPIFFGLTLAAHAQIDAVADPQVKFSADNTVVWSPLVQATWDELNRAMGGKPQKLSAHNALMTRLDNCEWDAGKVMPFGHWKTWGGKVDANFLEEVNREAAEMLGVTERPFDFAPPQDGTMAAFGVLNRQVEFEEPFFKSHSQALEFGDKLTPVQFFGVKDMESEDFRAHVRVLAYRPVDGSHALEIACKGTKETLVLYRPAKPLDFATACRWVKQWRDNHKENAAKGHGNWNDGRLHENDTVKIPYLTLQSTKDYTSQLGTGRWYGIAGDPWSILKAEQKTFFKLTEKGAEARISVGFGAGPFGDPPHRRAPYSRDFIYDQPFFAFLWRDKADWPYLGVWVGDTSAMTLKK